jgi:cellulose synthase (UDP-forming)
MQTIKPVAGDKRFCNPLRSSRQFRLQAPTLIILSALGLMGAIATSWLLGNSHVTELFIQLHLIQSNPPQWLTPPQLGSNYYLLVPTLILFLVAQVIMKLFPEPTVLSQRLVGGLCLILFVRYFAWRAFCSLNVANPADGIFSITLLGMELLAMIGTAFQLLLLFTAKSRTAQADRCSIAVKEGRYNPTVDILIPTYNEPDFIVKRTIMGCQALNYERKQIYVLDDTRRQSIKQLAQELGCHYLTRPDNSHAKAGNLNNALKQTYGELVVVFDADFIPTTNFLERTVGFFHNPKIGLLQTPQSYYNSDPIARNLGLEHVLTPEEEVFYRYLQPIRDGAGSVVCAGTSFIARRSALQEIDYFVTDSVSEDYFTGIRLSAKGYELAYLSEKLSAGLAAESIGAHVDQRLRWGRGTLQAFFIKSNPLTIPGLNPWQRLAHLEGLAHWLTCFPRVFFLFVPIISTFAQLNPIETSLPETLYVTLPYYVLLLSVFSWLNRRSRSILLSDVYSIVQAIPVLFTVVKVLLNPFGKGFIVTPKGMARDKFNYNWSLAIPMSVLLGATLISFSMCLLTFPETGLSLGLVWGAYNLVTIAVAMMTLLDLPKLSLYEWYERKQEVNLYGDRQIYEGKTQKISEEGVEIILDPAVHLPTNVMVELIPEVLVISGKVTRSCTVDGALSAIVKFQNLTIEQHRELVELLYCRPGQWETRKIPNELQSGLILFKLLLRPLVFLNSKKVKQMKLHY